MSYPFAPSLFEVLLCTSPPLLLIGAIIGFYTASKTKTPRLWPAIAGALGAVVGAWLAVVPLAMLSPNFPKTTRDFGWPALILGTVLGARILSSAAVYLRTKIRNRHQPEVPGTDSQP
jgi:hypothetical protein